MKVTYIYHSGFFVEMENVCFLFDYYKGTIPDHAPEKPLVVFVSHRHGDHYNPKIFELALAGKGVHYVIPKDVPYKRELDMYEKKGVPLAEYITVVRRNETQSLALPNGVTVDMEMLASTDEGVAYLLKCEGKTVYHAGDLNLWVWREESKQYNHNMQANYFRELNKLKDMKIDAAFVPLDPRQGEDAFGGLEAFMEYARPEKVYPMHCWKKYSIIRQFLDKHPEYAGQIVKIEREGQEFLQ